MHPLVPAWRGPIRELSRWTRGHADQQNIYRQLCQALPSPTEDHNGIGYRDPGPRICLYSFTVGELSMDSYIETVYVGVTRNPHIRFQQHRRRPWWRRVTHAYIDHLDCRYHEGPVCSALDLDRAARMNERWLIDFIEPTENILGGCVD